MSSLPDSPLYLTGSREVAKKIKELVPATMASTGGPNTMIATEFSPAVRQASRWSTLIENSGQCTAMRHLVVPDLVPDDVVSTFREAPPVSQPLPLSPPLLPCDGLWALPTPISLDAPPSN